MIPRLTPCRDVSEGVTDRPRYDKLGLPSNWTKRFFATNTSRWIAPDEYFWTPDEFFLAFDDVTVDLLEVIRTATGGSFFKMTLKEQCKLLNVPYKKMPAETLAQPATQLTAVGKRSGMSIEEFVLKSFRNEGWEGDYREGASIHFLIGQVGTIVKKAGIKFFPGEWEPGSPPIVRHEVQSTEAKVLNEAIETLSDVIVTQDLSPEVSISPRILQLFGKTVFRQICERVLLGYYGMGWPDLTLFRGDDLRFIEVKQRRDKFTHRQPYWFRNFARPLDLNVQVFHVFVP